MSNCVDIYLAAFIMADCWTVFRARLLLLLLLLLLAKWRISASFSVSLLVLCLVHWHKSFSFTVLAIKQHWQAALLAEAQTWWISQRHKSKFNQVVFTIFWASDVRSPGRTNQIWSQSQFTSHGKNKTKHVCTDQSGFMYEILTLANFFRLGREMASSRGAASWLVVIAWRTSFSAASRSFFTFDSSSTMRPPQRTEQ